MTRRTRRVTFNIEANGSVSPKGPRRRRRRELLNPYLTPMPMMFDPAQPVNPWGFNWNPSNILNGENFLDRLTAGDLEAPYPFGGVDDIEMDSGVRYEPNPQPPTRSLKKTIGQQAIDDLKDILFGLETHLAAEKVKGLDDNATNKEADKEALEDQKPPEISEISVLTDFMSETVQKLNNYLAHHSQEHNVHDNHMDSVAGPPVSSPIQSPMQILLLPVQPLIVQNPSNSSNPNTFESESESRPPKRQYVNTLPWLRKPRKRPPKSSEYVRVQNRGSSTEDLDSLPKILEATKSEKTCSKFWI